MFLAVSSLCFKGFFLGFFCSNLLSVHPVMLQFSVKKRFRCVYSSSFHRNGDAHQLKRSIKLVSQKVTEQEILCHYLFYL